MKTRSERTLPEMRRVAERFAQLGSAILDGVLIYEAGVVLNATRGAAQLLGRSETEMQCRRVHELVTQNSRVAIEQQLGSLERVKCPAMALRADGSMLPVELSVEASVTIGGRRVQVVGLRDVSRDEAEPHLTDRSLGRRKSAAALNSARN
jgi:PAS domain S-box-containing protein